MVDFFAFDGLVSVVFPGAREGEAGIVHLAGVLGEVVAQDVVDAPQGVGAGFGQFTGPELYLLAKEQHFLVLSAHL